MKLKKLPRAALAIAMAGVVGAALPALGDVSSSANASASSSATGTPAQFSETVGVATPQKRIVGTAQGTGAAAGDDRLLDQVVQALMRDPETRGADIQVRVDSGTVTLDGKAKDSAQADHARQVAEGIAGQGKVTSRLSTAG